MKELELVANRGATFLFSVKKLNGWTDSQWMTALANLEILGIGDRTTEGFGQIRFCDEFHTIFRENAV
jgi:CRISPR-associated protein Csx10